MKRRPNEARGRGGGESKIKGAGATRRSVPCLHILSAGAARDERGAADSMQALEEPRPSPAPSSAGFNDSMRLARAKALR
jgi:hypothetical protein